MTRRAAPNFFRGLGKNTCLIQPALKSNAPGLENSKNIFGICGKHCLKAECSAFYCRL